MSDFQQRLQAALASEFRLERELGGAGMSRVFVATEIALGRRVVVKVLPPDLAAGVNVERFRREIQLAAQLQHPHIVPLLAAGDDAGLLWFSMPYIDGESLRGTLTRQQRLSARDVVRILHDVVDALAYAHSRGVVHRDIKPDNILTSGMHALVTDFGVAKALSAASPAQGGTTTGMAIGTPAYMAPEQLAADPAADHRVDLYAVGLLAYELLTGKAPFSGSSPQATLAAQLTQMPEPPHRSFSDIPEPLSSLIMHCLEKDAARRPQSALLLLAELDALPPMTSGATLAPRRTRPRPALLVAGLAAVAAVVWAVLPHVPQAPASLEALDARDAGPGGGAPPASVTDSIPVRGTTGTAQGMLGDTVAVFRDISDGARSTAVPLVITRAESLAIADAIRKRQSQQPPRPATAPTAAGATGTKVLAETSAVRVAVRMSNGMMAEIDRELLMSELGRIFSDSMSRAIQHMDSALARVPRVLRMEPPRPESPPGSTRTMTFVAPLVAPPSDGRLRVVVTNWSNATGRREFAATAREAATLMRTAIPGERYDVMPPDLTERAVRMTPDQMAAGWALRADFLVNGWLTTRGDSLVVATKLTDVKTGRFVRVMEHVMAAGENPGKSMELARQQVASWLDTAATATKRRARPETGEVRR
ncbi:serine/threonine-protein kinase [Gemmatimonas phototrophica]|uniref:serine/threonine-protein kinase n=1 Tax=Gemmatimonas phototrophica TaxID=1379270 RepID=UPI0006A6FCAF|nr:serine/threonine-protein kinase [Gemmatimonas phototrophica]